MQTHPSWLRLVINRPVAGEPAGSNAGAGARLRSQPPALHTRVVMRKPIGQEWDERTYAGLGPHPADPRAAEVAARIAALIDQVRPGTTADHVGSTAVPGLVGKDVVDLQITADPAAVPAITGALLGLGFARQQGRDPWPPQRPMLEGTFRCHDGVFAIHCHVVPTTDPDARQMIEFRDLLRSNASARQAYAADKLQIAASTCDSMQYTHAKTPLIHRLLGN